MILFSKKTRQKEPCRSQMEDKMSAALFQRKTRQKVPCRSQMSAVILEEGEAESFLPLTNGV